MIIISFIYSLFVLISALIFLNSMVLYFIICENYNKLNFVLIKLNAWIGIQMRQLFQLDNLPLGDMKIH